MLFRNSRPATSWAMVRRLLLAPALLASVLAAWVSAGPIGEQVIRGDVAFERQGDLTLIRAGNNSIIKYQSFDIARSETVRFLQPDAAARVLNRIAGSAPTSIEGSLLANGHVFLVNPAGVYFGQNSIIDVGGIHAAAGNISDSDFLNGVERYTGLRGEVINRGSITANTVTLAGSRVANYGSIVAERGMIAMAAGDEVLIGKRDGHILVKVEGAAAGGDAPAVENAGTVEAEGGSVAIGAGDVYSLAIRTTGTLKASEVTVEGQGTGAVEVSGTVDASNPSGQGGSVRILGERVGLVRADIDASGATGGGEVLIGGNYQGSGPERNASLTYVSADSLIRADSLQNGNGGKVIVWSDGFTAFGGRISAVGGPSGGDGGFAEVSGKGSLQFAGTVDLRAPAGAMGTLLLDPPTLTVTDAPVPPPGTQDANLAADNQILAVDPSLPPDTVTWQQIFNLGNLNMLLQAGTVTIGDITGATPGVTVPNRVNLLGLTTNTLLIQSTAGPISFTDPNDVIATGGGNVFLMSSAGGGITGGGFDLAGGQLTFVSNGSAIQVASVANAEITLGAGTGAGTTTFLGNLTNIGTGTGPAIDIQNGVTGLVRFQGTVGANSGLTSAAGTSVRFDQDVTLADGNTATNLAGAVQLDGLTFSGYDGLTFGATTLSGGAVTLNSNAGNIQIGSLAGGGQNLTLAAGIGGGTTTVTGNVTNLGTGTGAALAITSGVTGLVRFQGTVGANSGIVAGAATSNVRFDGDVTLGNGDTATSLPGATASGGSLLLDGLTFSGFDGFSVGDLTLSGGPVSLNSNGSAIQIGSITGGGQNLTLAAGIGVGTTTVTGNVTNLGTGTGAALTIASGVTGLARFWGTVGGNSGLSAAVGTSVRFDQDVALTNGTAGTNLAGAVQLDGLTFSGYDGLTFGATTLSGGAVTLNSNGYNIQIASLTGNQNLTLAAGIGAGTTSVTGNVTNLGTGTGAALDIQAGATGLVLFQNTLGANSGLTSAAGTSVRFDQDVTLANGNTATNLAGAVQLDGLTFSGYDGLTFGATTLSGGAVTLNSNGGNIQIASLTGAQNLTLAAGVGAGTTTVTGNVTNLGTVAGPALTIASGVTGLVTFQGTVGANSGLVASGTTSNVQFDQNVTLANGNTGTNLAGSVLLPNGVTYSGWDGLTFGTLTIPDGATTTVTAQGPGTVTINTALNLGDTTTSRSEILTINGNLVFAPAASLAAQLGTNAGDGDRLNVNGTVTLNSCTLNANLVDPSSPPARNAAFMLIANDSNDAVNGQFSGGSPIIIDGYNFSISYTGGTGNDVVLTKLGGTFTWDGGGGDSNWRTGQNWVGNVRPAPGDDLVFDGGIQTTNTSNYTAGTVFNSITFSAGGFTLNGNSVQLTTGISNTTGTNTVNLPVSVAGAINAAGGTTLNINQPVTLTGALSLTGSGTMNFNNTATGPFNLTVDGATRGAGTTTFAQAVSNLGTGTGAALDVQSGATGLVQFQNTLGANSGLTSAAGTSVRFDQDVTLGNGNTATNLAGAVQLDGLTFSGNDGLTLGATTLSGGAVTLNSNGGNIQIASLTGAQNLTLAAGIGTGTTTVTGNVTGLGTGTGAALTIASGVTGLVYFQGTVGANSGIVAQNASSNVRFDQDVTLANGDTATSLPGAVQLDGLTFSGFDGLTFGNLTLSGGPVTLNSNGSPIVIGSLTGAQNLTLAAGIGAGTTTVTGNVTNLGTGTGAALTIVSGVTGLVRFMGTVGANSGLVAGAATSNVRFDGDVTLGNGDTGTSLPGATASGGSLLLDGLTFSGFDGFSVADLTLSGGPVTLNSNGGAIQIGSLAGGGQNLTLAAGIGAGTTTVTGSVSNLGTGTGAALTIQNGVTGLVRFWGTVGANSGLVASGTTSDVRFDQNVTLADGDTGTNLAGSVFLPQGVTYSGWDNLTFGTLTIPDAATTTTVTSQGPGSVTINTALNLGDTTGSRAEVLTVNGNLAFGAGATFAFQVGSAAGQIDRLNVNGTVNLNGVAADASLVDVDAPPGPNSTFQLLYNDSNDAITGNFATGASVSVSGHVFNVNKAGGTGNDIVLTKAPAQTRTWDGGSSTNSNWTRAWNWVGNVAPVAGDLLVFPNGAARQNNSSDFTAGTAFGSITITGGAYTLNGNRVVLAGGISNTSGTHTVNLPVDLAGAINVTGTQLSFSQAVTLTGALSLTGSGTMNFNSTFGGPHDLTLAASRGAGTTTFAGAVSNLGSGTGAAITIASGVTGLVRFQNTLDANSGLVAGAATSSVRFDDNVTLADGDTATSLPGAVQFAGLTFIGYDGLTFGPTTLSTGNLILNSKGGNILFTGALAGGSQNLELAGEISAGTTTVTGNVTGLGSAAGGAALTIQDGVTGLVRFQGAVGANSGLTAPGTTSNVQFDQSVTLADGNTGTTLAGGTLLLNGVTFSGYDGLTFGTLTIADGASAILTPSSGIVTINTALNMGYTATVPYSFAERLRVNGDLTFASGASFAVQIGDDSGERDEVRVTGTATLNNATLSPNLSDPDAPPDKGNTFRIVDGGTLSGQFTFAGSIDGYAFSISYAGNDVELKKEGQTRYWDGGSNANDNWNTKQNWDNDKAIAKGDDLVFPGTGVDLSSLSNNNDLSNYYFSSIAFTGGGYTLNGNAVQVTAGISNTTGTNTVNLPVSIAGTINAAGGTTLNINQPVTLTGALSLTGSGTMSFGSTVGGLFNLTLDATRGAGTTTFAGNLSNLGTGTGAAIDIQGGVTGLVWFQGTVGANSGIAAAAGTNVQFDQNVTLGNGDTGTNLAGAAQLSQAAGLAFSGYDGLTFNNLTLASGPVTLNSNGGAIQIASLAGGGQNLTLAAGIGIGTTTFTGAVTNLGTGTGAALTIASGVTGLVAFQGTLAANSGLTAAAATSNVRFDGDVTLADGDTGTSLPGGVTLDGLTFSGYDGLTLNAVNLSGGTVVLNSNGGNIQIGSIAGGGQNLELAAGIGGGTTTISLPVSGLGSGTGPALTIQNGVTGLVRFQGTVGANSGLVGLAGTDARFDGDVTLGDGDTGTNLAGTVFIPNGVTFSGYDGLTFGSLTIPDGATVGLAANGPSNVIINNALNMGSTLNSYSEVLNVTGNLVLLPTATLTVQMGDKQDQIDNLNVTGTVTLNNATLTGTFVNPTFPMAAGKPFTLITNDVADGVNGTFGVPPNLPAYIINVNYAGGDGNDVVLSRQAEARIWDGVIDGGPVTLNNNWTNQFNWVGDRPIGEGDALVFPAPSPGPWMNPNDDFPLGITEFASIEFWGAVGGFNLIANPGSDVRLTSGDSAPYALYNMPGAGANTVTLPLRVAGTARPFAAGAGSILNVNGGVTLEGPLTLAAPGVMNFGGPVTGPFNLTLDASRAGGPTTFAAALSNIGSGTGAAITIQNGVAGPVWFQSTVGANSGISAGSGTTVRFDANVTLADGDTVTNLANNVLFDGLTFSGYDGLTLNAVNLSGGTVVLNSNGGSIQIGSIAGGGQNLELAAGIGGGTTTISLPVSGLGSGTGPALLIRNGVTGLVHFQSTLDANSGLVAQNASSNVQFDGNVTLANGDTGTSLPGALQLDGLTFSGFDGLSFGDVTLSGGGVTLNSNASGNIQIGSLAGNQNLTLAAGTGASTTTVTGNVTNLGTGTGAALTIQNGVTGLVRFNGTVAANSGLAAPGAASSVRFDQDVTLANGNTATNLAGAVQLDGLTFSGFDGLTVNAVTLSGGPVTLNSNGSAIQIATLTGAQNLTLAAGIGAGTTTFTGAVTGLGTNAGPALTVRNGVTGLVYFQSTVGGNSGLVAEAGTNVRFDGDVTLANSGAGTNLAGNVQFDGLTFSGYNGITLGTATFSGASVTLDAHGSPIQIGSLTLNDNIPGTLTASQVTIVNSLAMGDTLNSHSEVLAVNGNLVFQPTTTLSVQIGNALDEIDRLDVTGTVTLNSAVLDAHLVPGLSPPAPVNTTFLLINNDLVDAVNGTFSNTPPPPLPVDGYEFDIIYNGGSGNDVVLQKLSAPRVWDGGAGSSDLNWYTPANWQGDVRPDPGDVLIFAGNTSTTNNNNYTADTDFCSITFQDMGSGCGNFVLGGNSITLSSGANAVDCTIGTQTIGLRIGTANTQTFTTAAGTTLNLNGIVTVNNLNPLTLNVDGGGTLNANGAIALNDTLTLTGGGAMNFQGGISGPHNVTLAASRGAGQTTFQGALSNIGSGTGAAITIQNGVTGLVRFQNTVGANSGIVANGITNDVRFDADVTLGNGDTATNMNCSLRFDGLTFSGFDGLTFGTAVLSAGPVTLDSNGSNIQIGSLLGSQNLVLAPGVGAGTTSFTGSVTNLGSGVGPAVLIRNGVTGLVRFQGSVDANSGIVAEAATSNVRFDGDTTLANGDTATNLPGAVQLDGLTFSGFDGLTFGALTLSDGPVTLNSNGSPIQIGTLTGAQNLTLASGIGTGTTTVTGAVTNLGTGAGAALTVQNGVSGLVHFQSTLGANSGLSAPAGSSLRFDGDVTLANGDTATNLAGAVQLDGLTFSGWDGLTFNAVTLSGAPVTLNSNASNIEITTLTGAQNLTLAAGIGGGTTTVTGNVTNLGSGTGAALTIANGVTGLVHFQGTVGGNSGLSAPGATSDVRFDGNVTLGNGDTGTSLLGAVQLDGLAFSGYDGLTFNALTLSDGPVSLNSNGGNILVTTLTGAQNLTLAAGIGAGTTTVQGAVTGLGTGTGAALTVQSGVTGLVTFQGTVGANSGLTAGAGTSVQFDQDVTLADGGTGTNLAGNVTFDGMGFNGYDNLTFSAVTLSGGPVTLDSNNSNIQVTTLTGAQDLTLASGIGAGSITFAGAVTNLGDGVGPALTVQNGVTGLVRFQGTVGANSGIVAQNASSNLRFDGDVTLGDGNTGTSLPGTVQLDGLTFSGYDGLTFNAVTLSGGQVTLNSNNSNILVTTLTGAQDLVLDALIAGGTTTFTGAVTNLGDGVGSALTVQNGVTGLVRFQSMVGGNSGLSAAAGTSVRFDQDVTLADGIGATNLAGNVQLDGLTFSGCDGLAFGALTLSDGSVTLNSNGGPIQISTLTGAQNLTLASGIGAGTTTVTGAVTNLGTGTGAALTVEDGVTGFVTFQGTVGANSGLYADAGTRVRFDQDVTLVSGDTGTNLGGLVQFDGLTFSGFDGLTFNSVVLSGGPVIIGSNGSDIVLGPGAVNGAQALTLNSGVGTTRFTGVVGAIIQLLSLTTDAGGTTEINGGSIATTGAQDYKDPVVLNAGADATTLAGAGITFEQTLGSSADREDGLTINDSGQTVFSAAVGGVGQRLASLTTDAAGSTLINGGTVTVIGAQTYNDKVLLAENTTTTLSWTNGADASTVPNSVILNGPLATAPGVLTDADLIIQINGVADGNRNVGVARLSNVGSAAGSGGDRMVRNIQVETPMFEGPNSDATYRYPWCGVIQFGDTDPTIVVDTPIKVYTSGSITLGSPLNLTTPPPSPDGNTASEIQPVATIYKSSPGNLEFYTNGNPFTVSRLHILTVAKGSLVIDTGYHPVNNPGGGALITLGDTNALNDVTLMGTGLQVWLRYPRTSSGLVNTSLLVETGLTSTTETDWGTDFVAAYGAFHLYFPDTDPGTGERYHVFTNDPVPLAPIRVVFGSSVPPKNGTVADIGDLKYDRASSVISKNDLAAGLPNPPGTKILSQWYPQVPRGLTLLVAPPTSYYGRNFAVNTVLDERANGAPANIAQALASAMVTPIMGLLGGGEELSQAMRELLEQLGIFARDLTDDERESSANKVPVVTFDDTAKTDEPQPRDYTVAAARLPLSLVYETLDTYKAIFWPDGTKYDNAPVKSALQKAFDAYKATTQQVDPLKFREFVEKSPEHKAALDALNGLRKLFQQIANLGLTDIQIRNAEQILVRPIVPVGMTDQQLIRAIKGEPKAEGLKATLKTQVRVSRAAGEPSARLAAAR